ncbi:Gpn-loop gtpase 1, partial [Globisporangium splendens]
MDTGPPDLAIATPPPEPTQPPGSTSTSSGNAPDAVPAPTAVTPSPGPTPAGINAVAVSTSGSSGSTGLPGSTSNSKGNTSDVLPPPSLPPEPPSGNPPEGEPMSVGTIVGITLGCVLGVLLIGGLAFWYWQRARRRRLAAAARKKRDDNLMTPHSGEAASSTFVSMSGDSRHRKGTTSSTFLDGDGRGGLWEDETIIALRIPLEKIAFTSLINRGGFGEVHLGTYREQRVAIKKLLPESRRDLDEINAFLREAKMMASLDHPHVIQFIGVAWDSLTDLCVVSEYMEGRDLRALLVRFETEERRPHGFDVDKVMIATHVAQALTYLHSLDPIVLHRDLKSMNILLNKQWHAKVADFGVARESSYRTMTAGVGTSLWMAPEVMMGERYDDKADIFSFGVVLSELDSHALPYAHAKQTDSGRVLPDTAILQLVSFGRVQIQISEKAPPAIAALAQSCVALDPKARPTAVDRKQQLSLVGTSESISTIARSMADLPPAPAAAASGTQPPAAPSAYEKLALDPSIPKMYPKPVTMLVIGMAGSGKTTLMQRIATYGLENGMRNYIVNLDPAVRKTGYTANIDIRDTVDYKQVMTEYGLGPNGAIMTSLNLFATRFDQVIDLIGKRSKDLEYVASVLCAFYAVVDTPGQIEAFTWSASGQIITESLASTFPSVIVYVVDTPRTASPNTFMSNMLYACSILYKLRLPFVIAFNKIDVLRHDFAQEWMTDFEAFQTALDQVQDDSYMGNLSRSLSLVLEEFYNNLSSVGVSAATGEGMDKFFLAIDDAAKRYEQEYLPDLLERIREQQQQREEQQDANLTRVMQDMDISAAMGVDDGDSAANARAGAPKAGATLPSGPRTDL